MKRMTENITIVVTKLQLLGIKGEYRWVGEVDAGLQTPGDLRIALPLPSDTDELEAAVDCLFSRQHSSNFTSSISSYK